MLGVMVGDVGYGAVLMVLALLARRSLAARAPALADLTWVALAGAAWSIVFGVLYGEFFGDLGKRLVGGDWALWMYRPSAEALEPLLLFAVAIGAAHVVLGLGSEPGRPLASGSAGRCSTSSGRCSRSAASSASPAGPRTICPPAP